MSRVVQLLGRGNAPEAQNSSLPQSTESQLQPIYLGTFAGAAEADAAQQRLRQRTIIRRKDKKEADQLMKAASKNDVKGVQDLLALHPNLLIADGLGNTALHLAAQAGHLEVVRCLLKYAKEHVVRGTLIMQDTMVVLPQKEEGEGGLDALYSELKSPEAVRVVKQVVEGIKLGWTSSDPVANTPTRPYKDFRNRHECTALHLAATNGHRDVVALLLLEGVQVDIRAVKNPVYSGDVVEGTALHAACLIGHEDIAQLLLASHADVRATDVHQRSPLHNAAISGSLPIVKLLKEKGAYLHNHDDAGKSPQDLATEHKKYRVAGFLLLEGTRINVRSAEGYTAMHFAAMANDVAWADELEKAGALPHLRDNQAMMPVDWAVLMNNSAMVDWLFTREPDLDETLASVPLIIRAVRAGKLEAARQVMKFHLGSSRKGIQDRSCTGLSDRYPTHNLTYSQWALVHRKTELIDLFNEAGVPEAEEIKLVREFLEEAKAIPSKADLFSKARKGGATALHLAVATDRLPICLTICELFIAREIEKMCDALAWHSDYFELCRDLDRYFGTSVKDAHIVHERLKTYFPEFKNVVPKELRDKECTDENWESFKETFTKLVTSHSETTFKVLLGRCKAALETKVGDRAELIREALYHLTGNYSRQNDEPEPLVISGGQLSEALFEKGIGASLTSFVLQPNAQRKEPWQLAEESRYLENGDLAEEFDDKVEIARELHFNVRHQDNRGRITRLISYWIESTT